MIFVTMFVNAFRGLTERGINSPAPGRGLVNGFHRHFTERRVLARLARMSPHLMRDMGFDPEDIRAAADGEMRASEPFRRRLTRRRQEAGATPPAIPDAPAAGRQRPQAVAPTQRLEAAGRGECR